MTVPVITPLPAAPTRADAPSDFTSKADAFVADQYRWSVEFNSITIPAMNAAAIQVNNDADQAVQAASDAALERAEAFTYKNAAELAASNAATSESNASGSELAAANSANASDGFAQAAANSASDAEDAKLAADGFAQDAEYWADQAQQSAEGGIIDDTSLLATRVRSALDASRGHFATVAVASDATIGVLDFAQITATGIAVTVTLPATPESGQMVMVGNLTDRSDHRIAVGTVPVKGQAGVGHIVIDKPFFTITLKFVSAGYGWELL